MEQLDFNSLFDDFFSAGEKKVTKKEEKKEVKKNDKKAEKTKAKAAGDVDIALPATVKARGFHTVISGEGTKKASDIYNELKETYPQLLMSGFGLLYGQAGGSSVVYVTENVNRLRRQQQSLTYLMMTEMVWRLLCLFVSVTGSVSVNCHRRTLKRMQMKSASVT